MIKENGGIVIVHIPHSCNYSSMPESATRTGSADYESLPKEMPRTILKHMDKWIKHNGDK